jgi:hypothetical protein
LSTRPVLQVQNLSQGCLFEVAHSLSPRQVEILFQGGLLNLAAAPAPG